MPKTDIVSVSVKRVAKSAEPQKPRHTEAQHEQHKQWCAEAREGVKAFTAVCATILRIQDLGVWRETHRNFALFCADELGVPFSRAKQLAVSATVFRQIGARVDADTQLPSDRVALEVAKHAKTADDRAALWEKVQRQAKANGLEKITSRFVAQVAGVAPREVKPRGPGDGANTVSPAPGPAAGAAVVDHAAAPANGDGDGDPGPADGAPRRGRPRNATADKLGNELVHPWLVDAFTKRQRFDKVARALREQRDELLSLIDTAAGAFLARQRKSIEGQANAMVEVIRLVAPFCVCPYCAGERCKQCQQSGYLPEELYKVVPSELKYPGHK